MVKVEIIDRWVIANQYLEQVEPQIIKIYGQQTNELIKESLIHFLNALTANDISFLKVENILEVPPEFPIKNEEIQQIKQSEQIIENKGIKPQEYQKSIQEVEEQLRSPEEFNKKIKELNESLQRVKQQQSISNNQSFDEELSEEEVEEQEVQIPKPTKKNINFMQKLKQTTQQDLDDDDDD